MIAALLYFCALGTFGGLCIYYALDTTVTTESLVVAEPRAGAEWNCSLIVTHTDTQPASFEQAWLDAKADAVSAGAGVSHVVGLGADDLVFATFTSGGSAGYARLSLLPATFLQVSWEAAYFASQDACVAEAGAALAATPTFDAWQSDMWSGPGGSASLTNSYALGRFAADGALPGVSLDFSRTALKSTMLAQIYVHAFAQGGIVDVNTPAVAVGLAALAASPFMVAVRAQYIEMICKPFAALKPYSCARTTTKRRLPLVRASTRRAPPQPPIALCRRAQLYHPPSMSLPSSPPCPPSHCALICRCRKSSRWRWATLSWSSAA